MNFNNLAIIIHIFPKLNIMSQNLNIGCIRRLLINEYTFYHYLKKINEYLMVNLNKNTDFLYNLKKKFL
jgi:hypothetical protein